MQQVNPNTASAQSFRYTFKKEIDFACQPGSLPKGTIGITKTGVAIYNPLTSADLNAGMDDITYTLFNVVFKEAGWSTNYQNLP